MVKRIICIAVALFFLFLIASPIIVRSVVGGEKYFLLGISDAFELFLSVAGKLAIIVTVPIGLILFYRWAYDALLPEEKQWIRTVGAASVLLFIFGAILGILLFPRLVGIARWISAVYGAYLIISIKELVDMALMMAILTGLVFQFPLVMFFLIRTGILPERVFRENRHIAYGLFFIVSMFITPGDMLFTDLILTAVFVGLYEATLFVAGRKA